MPLRRAPLGCRAALPETHRLLNFSSSFRAGKWLGAGACALLLGTLPDCSARPPLATLPGNSLASAPVGLAGLLTVDDFERDARRMKDAWPKDPTASDATQLAIGQLL